MSTGMKQLPRLKLCLENILRKAESRSDLVTYSSSLRGVAYITDKQDVLILTRSSGYLRLPIDIASKVMEEVEYVSEDAERRNRD